MLFENEEYEDPRSTEEKIIDKLDFHQSEIIQLTEVVNTLKAELEALKEKYNDLAQTIAAEEEEAVSNIKMLNIVSRTTKSTSGITFDVMETNDLEGYQYPVQLDKAVKKLVNNWQLAYDPSKMEVIIKANGYPLLTLIK